MIYVENGITVVEYGHGSIFGFVTGKDEDGVIQYGLVSADKGEIDRPCEIFDSVRDQPLESVNPSVIFKFRKKESLKIFIDALEDIYIEMGEK